MRYRGSIYVDIWIDDENIGEVRQEEMAKQELMEHSKKIPNSFVGGVAKMLKDDLLGNSKRLDKI